MWIIAEIRLVTGMAQSDEQIEKFNRDREAYFNENLELTQAEAAAFWPLYNDYHNRKMKLSEDERNNFRYAYSNADNLSEKELTETLNKIRDLGLLDNSLILFLSDHGHPLGEHGKILKMDDQLYSQLVRIPLMVRFPKAEYAGKRIKGLVETVDILPTVLDFLGHGQEAEFMHGKSFLPLVRGEQEKIRETVTIGFFSSDIRCIRDEEWSYIRKSDPQACELYHLLEDPDETTNVLKKYPDKAKEMEKALARIFRIRYQKEHWFQVKYDVPGLSEERFSPVRNWKK